jgi:hypothetical protein
VLGGAAALVALLCLVGGVAVAAWLSTDGQREPAGPAVARPTAAASAGIDPVAPGPTAAAGPTVAAGPTSQDMAGWADLPALPAASEKKQRSSGSGRATQVAFVNARGERVTVFWLNEDGRRVEYQVLNPGETYTQQTYVGHPWVVSTADGEAVAVFQPAAAPGRAVIR